MRSVDLVSEGPDAHSGLSWQQAVAAFIAGGLLISLGDRAHIEFGVLVQDNTAFLGQAWWVVPMFGTVSLMLFYGYRALRIRFDEPVERRDPKKAAIHAGLFLIAYCSTGPLAGHGVSLALLLAGLWVVRVVMHREARATIILSLLIAVLGPIGEMVVAALGMFHYTNPDIGQVHSWLPAIYLHGGLVVPRAEALFLPVRQNGLDGVDPCG
jgi:hypothetical protein